MIIDIHTHRPKFQKNIKEIYVEDLKSPKNHSTPTCVGIHPWFCHEISWDKFLEQYNTTIKNGNFFALGEIGLDKKSNIDFNQQLSIFKKSLEFSNENNIKQIVLHNVKASSEILSELKNFKIKSKILLHDYNQTPEVYKSFEKDFDTYISLGPKLFKNTKISKDITKYPMEKILLETDDQNEFSIDQVYMKTKELLNMDENQLINTLFENYQRFSTK